MFPVFHLFRGGFCQGRQEVYLGRFTQEAHQGKFLEEFGVENGF